MCVYNTYVCTCVCVCACVCIQREATDLIYYGRASSAMINSMIKGYVLHACINSALYLTIRAANVLAELERSMALNSCRASVTV